MDRIIRKPEVRERSGLSDATIWRLEQHGEFPRRRQLGPGSVGWLESEVENWLESRQPAGPRAAELVAAGGAA